MVRFGNNLLKIGSFESVAGPGVYGWPLTYIDTSIVHFSQDVPPGGGFRETPVFTEFLGKGPPLLSGHRMGAPGSATILIEHPDTLIYRGSMYFADSIWTLYMFSDTISAEPGDSIIVSLACGQSQWSWGYLV